MSVYSDMSSLLLVCIFFSLQYGSLPIVCCELCAENEEYVDSVNPCNTCDDLADCSLFKNTEPGCDCVAGFYRNNDSICVTVDECVCGTNEVYKKCGSACPVTCSNRNGPPRMCAAVCVEGCFCSDGYMRNDNGRCVPPSECPKGVCGKNEVYKTCGTACPVTCSNRNKMLICTDQCVKGCFCSDGHVRNDDGQCVLLRECPVEKCEGDRIYSTCGSACPLSCSNKDNPPFCTLQCVPGCFCPEGLVSSGGGRCVDPGDCPANRNPEKGNPSKTDECGYNEIMVTCAKPKLCNTCENRQLCKFKCKRGCDCKEGHYRNETGICIPVSQCPGNCGYNEGMVACVKPYICNKCGTRPQCKIDCRVGCDCIEGYYRNESRICIPESQCAGECPINEVSSDCVIPCNDCTTRGKCQFLLCFKGCDCKKGYYRDDFRRCVPESECPNTRNCGEDKQYYECVPSCKNNCENYFNPGIRCGCGKPGCFCKEGLIMRDGKCVSPEECKHDGQSTEMTVKVTVWDTRHITPIPCRVDEDYLECGCLRTCSNGGKSEGCAAQCNRGCFCKEELVRNNAGGCVELKDCGNTTTPPQQCKSDEQFYECIPSCQRRCAAYTRKVKFACRQMCRRGCFCKDGLYQNKDGKCVPPSQC